MLSMTRKISTYRKAIAEARLKASPESWQRVKSNDLPKKDVLAVARTSGMMASKKTWELIPDCHPLPIDGVELDFTFEGNELVIRCSVETIWKTGVEMEALTAVSVAALTVYDMLKPIDKEMEITKTKLLSKKGGKSDFRDRVPPGFKAAVIVTSDGTAQGKRQDNSGRLIEERLKSFGIQTDYLILPDEIEEIKSALERYCQEGMSLIMTTGGTGLGPRDVTVEATQSVIEREVPGIMEAARDFGQKKTPYAMLSRGVVGQKGKTLLVNLPGSSKGVEESLDAIFPHLFHAYGMMRGGGH